MASTERDLVFLAYKNSSLSKDFNKKILSAIGDLASEGLPFYEPLPAHARWKLGHRVSQSSLISFGSVSQNIVHALYSYSEDYENLFESGKTEVIFYRPEIVMPIKQYLSLCKRSGKKISPDALAKEFNELLDKILQIQQSLEQKESDSLDVDSLVRCRKTGTIYVQEIKVDQNHDSSKTPGIVDKLLLTYAGYSVKYSTFDKFKIIPRLVYLLGDKDDHPYLPASNVVQGQKLCRLLGFDYEEVIEAWTEIRNDFAGSFIFPYESRMYSADVPVVLSEELDRLGSSIEDLELSEANKKALMKSRWV